MTKTELRKYYRQKRLTISGSELARLDNLLLIRFQQLVLPGNIQNVLSYWPIRERGEVNTFLFTDFMAFRMPGITLAYPVTDFSDNRLRAIAVNDETAFSVNAFGIGEPVDGPEILPAAIDLVIVPFLAFDQEGYRLGYGKGIYDRYLAKCSADAILLGFSYFPPIPQIPGKDEFDIPLTACITPEQTYEF